jgi:histidine triad (HIT) family protein
MIQNSLVKENSLDWRSSNLGKVKMTCIFCQIVARELPAEILFEDEDLAVFKDINPEAPVHLLIVPKKHFDSLNSLDEETAPIGARMLLTAKKMAESQGIHSGYKILINCGREAGQVIRHLHMHLMGGWGRKPARR